MIHRRELRARIAADVARFIAGGGLIEIIPPGRGNWSESSNDYLFQSHQARRAMKVARDRRDELHDAAADELEADDLDVVRAEVAAVWTA